VRSHQDATRGGTAQSELLLIDRKQALGSIASDDRFCPLCDIRDHTVKPSDRVVFWHSRFDRPETRPFKAVIGA
jgi:hypothetical protein